MCWQIRLRGCLRVMLPSISRSRQDIDEVVDFLWNRQARREQVGSCSRSVAHLWAALAVEGERDMGDVDGSGGTLAVGQDRIVTCCPDEVPRRTSRWAAVIRR